MTQRINISLPPDHAKAFRRRAAELGVTMSELLCSGALKTLSAKEQKKLSPRRKPGRPPRKGKK